MRLKLDENLGRSVTERLQGAGHDVATVRGQALAGVSDDALFEVCRGEERALVSLDLDFANPMRFDPETTAGIAVLRVPAFPTRTDLDEAATTLLEGLARASLTGRLWVVRRDAIRQYEPGDRS